MVYAIRGATTIENDNKEEITSATSELYTAVLERNKINPENIASIIISTTSDIKSYYPAAALRTGGVTDIPLFSCMEPEISGSLKLCIRLLITVNSEEKIAGVRHVYLNKAATLRPDLANK